MTESAHSDHDPSRRPETVQQIHQDRVHNSLGARSEGSASTEAGSHHGVQHSKTHGRQGVLKGSTGAGALRGSAQRDNDGRCECNSQSSSMLSAVSTPGVGHAADHWRVEAVSTAGSQLASRAEHVSSQIAEEDSRQPLRSRTWWPNASADDSLLHESNSSTTEDNDCASQAGEALGEYVMYRF